MNKNADKIACDLLLYPTDEKYDESIRHFQGCPTIAITPKGRIFAGWYSGGTREPHMENYNLLVYSDDGGKTWSEPILIIPSSIEHFIHALDIQLWTAPDGKLHVYWVQNNTALEADPKPELKENQPWVCVDGYQFPDFTHALWVTVCDHPDAEALSFYAPRFVDIGFLRCKPLVLKDGRWLFFNYDQDSDRYGYSISDDKGLTHAHHYGAKKINTAFDEAMAYEKEDGTIRMFARSNSRFLAESVSFDRGTTFTDARLTDIPNPNTRFYISRLPSGNLLLVLNDDEQERKNMSVWLSTDDGTTWRYKRCIDTRSGLSYPDADVYDGKIYLVYDRERTGAKEILFTAFTEEDIMNENYTFDVLIISKA